jgi:hypothetical protein
VGSKVCATAKRTGAAPLQRIGATHEASINVHCPSSPQEALQLVRLRLVAALWFTDLQGREPNTVIYQYTSSRELRVQCRSSCFFLE